MNISNPFIAPAAFLIALVLAFCGIFAVAGIVAAIGLYIDTKQTKQEEAGYQASKNVYPSIDRRKNAY